MEGTTNEEQQKDIDQRVEAFMKDYKDLIDKHQVDFISYPQYIPSNKGIYFTQIATMPVDTKYRPIPSPLNEEKIIKE